MDGSVSPACAGDVRLLAWRTCFGRGLPCVRGGCAMGANGPVARHRRLPCVRRDVGKSYGKSFR